MSVVVDPDLAEAAGTSLDDLVSRVRRELSDRDDLNVLASDVDENDTILEFKFDLDNVTRKTLLSVDDELMYVWGADIPGKTAEVQRGYDGPVQSHGAGALVTANGRSRTQIINAINDELQSLSASGLYQMKSLPVTIPGFGRTVSVPALAGSVVYDFQFKDSFDNTWNRLPGWRYDASDQSLTIPDLSYNFYSYPSRVLYKAPFTKLDAGDDDVQQSSGLQVEATDILVYGACYRLTVGDEYKRNDFRSQGDTRRADEVPYRAVALSRPDFKGLRDQRLYEEKNRLERQFPMFKPNW